MEFEDLWNAAKQGIEAFLVCVEPGDRTYKMLRRSRRRDRERAQGVLRTAYTLLAEPFRTIGEVLDGCEKDRPADSATAAYRTLKAVEIIRCIESAQHWFVLFTCLPPIPDPWLHDPFIEVWARKLLRRLQILC